MVIMEKILGERLREAKIALAALLGKDGKEIWRWGTKRPWSSAAVSRAMQSREEVVLFDILTEGGSKTAITYRLQSVVVIPLKEEEGIPGYLYFDSGVKGKFTERDIGYLEAAGTILIKYALQAISFDLLIWHGIC